MKDPEGPIFHNPNTGKALAGRAGAAAAVLDPDPAGAGARHRDAYQTRHTFATLLLMGGVNPTYIAKAARPREHGYAVQGLWTVDRGGGQGRRSGQGQRDSVQ
jgi:integrase